MNVIPFLIHSQQFSNFLRKSEGPCSFADVGSVSYIDRKRARKRIISTPFLRSLLWFLYVLPALTASAQTVNPFTVNSTIHGNPHASLTQSVTLVSINSTVQGNTTEEESGKFRNFTKIDVTMDNIGGGGQSLFQIEIQDGNMDIELSTCIGSDFDTYLALLDGNPHNETAMVSLVAGNGNDILCAGGKHKASLYTRVGPGTYYILVTGDGNDSGIFNLKVKGRKPSPTPLPWGLDRVDQRSLPLNDEYSVQASGADVWVYLVDSGVHVAHEEFGGRVLEGFDFVNLRKNSAVDCTGHGTHIAGIIAGKNFGVARDAKIVAVRAFGCSNEANKSTLINSMEWIIADVRAQSRLNVVVALMFSISSSESSTLRHAVRGLIRSEIPVVVPAGNNGADACDFYLSSVKEFMSVGSTDVMDARSDFSNSGNCTSIYAPGSLITSSWHTGNSASRVMSGTAQATAHMTGIVASLLDLNNNIRADVLNNVIKSISTKDVVSNVPSNDTTRFAFVRSVPRFSGEPPSKGNVFLFVVITINMDSCSKNSKELLSTRKTFAEILSLPESKVRVKCAELGARMEDGNSRNVEIRADVAERKAASTFSILESALVAEKERTSQSLGFSFTVAEKPWAVDSTPIVFWGAPSFSDAELFVLSKGAIAGAVVGAICIMAIIVATSWIVYRRVRGVDDIVSMQGSADLEKQPVHFNDFENANAESSISRSFRSVVRAMSFRRSASTRIGSTAQGTGAEKGMNRMGSFVGGPEAAMAKDVVRIDSFGGEAFAGMASISRSSSATSPDFNRQSLRTGSCRSDDLALSFRGRDNLVLNKNLSRRKSDIELDNSDPDLDEIDSMRMQSCGGEAFAMIGRQLTFDNTPGAIFETSKRRTSSTHETVVDSSMHLKTSESEAIAHTTEGLKQKGFFGDEK